jgi:hypothetical protein
MRSHIRQALKICSGHMIAKFDILVTTTGNVRTDNIKQIGSKSGEQLKEYFDGQDIGVPGHDHIVIVGDEMMLDQEIMTWSAFLCPQFLHKVSGGFLVEDIKQGKSLNLAHETTNDFSQTGDHALATRLISNGFEHAFCDLQGRMHPDILIFVSQKAYNGRIKSMNLVGLGLDDVHMGLRQTLCKAYGQALDTPEKTLRLF